MTLHCIDIVNFKNIAAAQIEFSPGVNCLLGNNGMGKSNLLESIHFLSMTRPMSTVPDSALVRHGEEMLMVKGEFGGDAGSTDIISIGLHKGKPKSLKRNGKEYGRISEHIGRYPVVTVTPGDSTLVSGPGEERRKLMDMVISQAEPGYLSSLMRYNRALESRNRMLRAGVRDRLLYESVETPMAEAAREVSDARAAWVRGIAPLVEATYARIAGTGERTHIKYLGQLGSGSLTELLDDRREKDQILGYTSAGPHRDELEATLDGYSLRRLGSQGQVKTFTIALRLAVFDYIRERSGLTPMLLLDDIFDKLDAGRVSNIMAEVSGNGSFGQIFITDTNRKHLDDIVSAISGPRVMLAVEGGTFREI